MYIRTKLLIIALLPVLLLLIAGGIVFRTVGEIDDLNRKAIFASAMAKEVSDLAILTYEHHVFYEERAHAQWIRKYDELGKRIQTGEGLFQAGEEKEMIGQIARGYRNLGYLFNQYGPHDTTLGRHAPTQAMSGVRERITSRIVRELQLAAPVAEKLGDRCRGRAAEQSRARESALGLLIMLMVVIVPLTSLMIMRAFSIPLRRLAEGFSAVSSGDLAFRINSRSWDEIGEVSRSFDSMALRLQESDDALRAVNQELENRVMERTAQLGEHNEKLLAEIEERQLAQKEAQLKATILGAVSDSVFLVDETGTIIYANDSACVTRGYGTEELVGMALGELDPPEFARVIPERLAEIREKGQATFETAHYHKDRSIIPLEINSRLVTIDGREIFLSVARDISERRKNLELIKANEARLKSIITISQYEAHSIRQLLDYALSEAVGLSGSVFGYIYHYDESKEEFTLNSWSREVMDACSVAEPQSIYKLERTGFWGEAVRQRQPVMVNDFTVPNPLLKGYPEGHAPLKRFMSVPIFSGRAIVGVVGVANKESYYEDTDAMQLTLLMNAVWKLVDRKRSEARILERESLIRSLIDAIPESAFLLDVNGNVLAVNETAATRLGQIPSCMMDRSIFSFFPPDIAEQRLRLFEEAVETKCPVRIQDKRDNSFFNVTFYPIVAPDGAVGNVALFAYDITEMKQTEESLKSAAAELERSNKELEQFAYVASHDLQEPLRKVASFTELLAKRYQDRFDDDGRKYVHFIVDGAQRMKVLINDLLAYSRVDSKGKPFEQVACGDLVQQVLSDLQLPIRECGATIHVGELPALHADRTQLGQLFLNLIANAIKFRGEKTPVLAISATRLTDGCSWEFRVSDNGIGIDPRYHERIFQLFQRLHSREEYPGTGLGLAICKRIVERHGGNMRVESGDGEGSTFVFTLADRSNEQ